MQKAFQSVIEIVRNSIFHIKKNKDNDIFDEVNSLCKYSFNQLNDETLEDNKSEKYNISYERPDIRVRQEISAELYSIRRGLIGEKKIIFLLRCLIVFCRRSYEQDRYYRVFEKLILRNLDTMIKILDTRWLLSIADTISDCSKDPTERSTALGCTLIMTTIKLYETERRFARNVNSDDENAGYHAHDKWVHFFDGINSFWIGNGDAPLNMFKRIAAVNTAQTPATKVFLEIIKRIHEHDTVYRRFRDVHEYEKTKW